MKNKMIARNCDEQKCVTFLIPLPPNLINLIQLAILIEVFIGLIEY